MRIAPNADIADGRLDEAAARRAQRFTTEGHAPWPVVPTPTAPHPEHPYTLDLRLHSEGRRIPPE